ncbi:FxLYD domain-containing protein [Streptomyces sp. NBC_00882]|uniref:FxLYD domain-containing protein n=1 Tax=Streptomyces TaxID=1883 RepID=UPI003869B2A4|nr:FxLYD domain-containing protein [Streptomyces sp. NBC_00882]WSZ59502.1 FxLYD domain-containing protein [Streptomyces canus]
MTRWTTAALLTTLAVVGLTACSDDDSPSSVASKVASAASRAGEAVSSATAEAGRRFDDISNGVDARDDVRLGTPATASDGRTTVEVTATNSADSAKSFTVEVDFTDRNGKLLDAVVLTVSDVPAGGSGKGTARSTHDLSGEVRAKVPRAVRH